tara:strand:- start:449 stop:1114 length:666 start_codon:yes stop_codon:yes gene_type:complete
LIRDLEICTFNLTDTKVASNHKISRIELCEKKDLGGITPRRELIKESLQLGTPIHPIIRPRGGDFNYSSREFDIMLNDVSFCRDNRCSGIVFGFLNKKNDVDISLCREIIKVSGNMSLTFHRAFDKTRNPFESMEKIIDLGFDRILTSGQKSDAVSGLRLINALTEKSNGRISIMPGAGVRSSNIDILFDNKKISEFHSSCYINNLFSVKELNRLIKKLES